MGKEQNPARKHSLDVSIRGFLTGAGAVISSSIVAGTESLQGARHPSGVNVFGPAKVSMTIKINGIQRTVELEPRITLLDALRSDLDLTGAKKVCDRGTCGSCTVMIDDKPAYACSILAIEAQNKDVRTIEGLAQGNNLHPVQQAFVENDAQQCGYCTPGMVMACKALLDKHPNPTLEQIKLGLGGNLCRCGTYAGITEAVLESSRNQTSRVLKEGGPHA